MNGPNNPIGWCDFTTNPVDGHCRTNCKLPDGRPYCWAIRGKKRFKRPKKITLKKDWFDNTDYRQAERFLKSFNRSPRIFVGDTHDIFGNWIDPLWIEEILGVCRAHPDYTFQFLTKNAMRYTEFDFPQNCWIGVTITCIADLWRVRGLNENLLRGGNNIRFISFEPLLERIDYFLLDTIFKDYIDWVIIGKLTGLKWNWRPAWAETIRRCAMGYGKPVFIKDSIKYLTEEPQKEFPG